MQLTFRTQNSRLALMMMLLLLLRLSLLQSYPLFDKTESRYAEIPREMLVLDDWVTPRLEAQTPFWGKPPLAFWTTAASYKAFGVNEFSARLPSFVLSLGTLILTILLGSILKSRSLGLRAGLILTTMSLFYVQAGFVSTDAAFGFCTTLALSSFAAGLLLRSRTAIIACSLVFFFALGLSMLAKGILGIVLILVPIIIWGFTEGKIRKILSRYPLFLGLTVMALVVVPWHVAAELRTPGFLEYYFVGEHFKRFIVKGWAGNLYGKSHQEPYGMIWLFALISTFPWCLPVIWESKNQGLRQTCSWIRSNPWVKFLLLWGFTPLIFFTGARNILLPYVYPSLPPCALLFALFLEPLRKNPLGTKSAPKSDSVYIGLVPVGFILAALLVLPQVANKRSQSELVKAYQTAAEEAPGELVYLSGKPYSADFYLGKDAQDISKDLSRALEAKHVDGRRDYFVVKDNEFVNFPQLSLTTLGRYGRYILTRES